MFNERLYPDHASVDLRDLQELLARDRYHQWRKAECGAGRHAWTRWQHANIGPPCCNRCGEPRASSHVTGSVG